MNHECAPASLPAESGVNRWSVLALLRFALALIVAVGHLAEYAPLGPLGWIPRLGAFEAILGFLLVSGYSIGASYRKSPSGFYLRRAQRIYPVYIAAMVLTYAATPVDVMPAFIAMLALNALFLNQVVTLTSYVGPAWSLSLEVWLYALTPAIAKLKPTQVQVLVLGSLALFAVNTCGRTLFHWPYFAGQGLGLNLLTLSFPWLLGFLLATARGSERQVLRWIAWAMGFHILLAATIQFGYRLKHDALDAFAGVDLPEFAMRSLTLVLVCACLAYVVRQRSATGTRVSWMNFLGDSSYPLYLTHVPIAILCVRLGVGNAFTVLGVMLMASAALYLGLDSYSRGRDRRIATATALSS